MISRAETPMIIAMNKRYQRPEGDDDRTTGVTISLYPTHINKLDALAAQLGLSRSATVARLLERAKDPK